MQRIYKGLFIITTLIFSSQFVWAQDEPVSVNPNLEGIFTLKNTKRIYHCRHYRNWLKSI